MKSFLKLFIVFCVLCLFSTSANAYAQQKIIYIPMDDRPVCLDYPVQTLKAAGYNVITPPKDMLASSSRSGNPDALYKWLLENASFTTEAVISADSMVYGGLVPSRKHELDEDILNSRVKRLLNLKKEFKYLNVYLFSTVMRSPRASNGLVEPAYYPKWGKMIFRYGELKDKVEQGVIKKKELIELSKLIITIPRDVQSDLDRRRALNLKVLKKLLKGIKKKTIKYYLIGRDDSAIYSEANRDANKLSKYVKKLSKYQVRFSSGADELGMLLLCRAVEKIRLKKPMVYPFYQVGVGSKTISSYENETVKESVRNHIYAAGGVPILSPKRADLILAVNTPVDGVTRSADSSNNTSKLKLNTYRFISKVEKYLNANKNVAIADVAFSNGADNALVKALVKDKDTKKLVAYAGWNTSSNSIGYAIGQGLLAKYMNKVEKDRVITVRLLDDWLYEANGRQILRKNLIWRNKWNDWSLTADHRKGAERSLWYIIHNLAKGTYLENEVNDFSYLLPWNRSFECWVKEAES